MPVPGGAHDGTGTKRLVSQVEVPFFVISTLRFYFNPCIFLDFAFVDFVYPAIK